MKGVAVLLLAIVIVGIIMALSTFMGCAHVFPARCDGQQLRDAERRIYGTADCYTCLAVAPGAFDEGNHYRCRDEMCSECEVPPVPLGKRRPDAGVQQRDAP